LLEEVALRRISWSRGAAAAAALKMNARIQPRSFWRR
jgi:hypothetical protein